MNTAQKAHYKSLIIILAAFALLGLGLCANAVVAVYLLQRDKERDTQNLAALIVDAVEDLGEPLVRDASGKQYIPEVNLVFPEPGPQLGGLAYGYTPAAEGIAEEVRVSSLNSIRTAKTPLFNAGRDTQALFAAVPHLQACGRGVQITFNPTDGPKADATKTLQNGKTAYIYAEKGCENRLLLEYVTQLDSY